LMIYWSTSIERGFRGSEFRNPAWNCKALTWLQSRKSHREKCKSYYLLKERRIDEFPN